ncbi:MAG: hypothetical protein FNT15_06790 [Sulfurovum sp.]|nr:MAG: hypothetical protein FNT15_06790 [Sulfurovum sp.]
MAVDKARLLRALQADRKSAEPLKKTWDMKRLEYISQFDGRPYGNEQEGKSAIVSKDIKKQSEWQHAGIIDPFVSSSNIVKCLPITFEDAEAARQNELLLNTQFCRKFDRYNFMAKAIKVLDREGTVVIQAGWDYQDEKVTTEVETIAVNEFGEEYLTTKEVEQVMVKKNQPTARVCRNEDIYIDPTCEDDMDKCQFIIYRYETDISTLRKDGRYKNLDNVSKSLGAGTYDYDYRPQDETRFQFEDDPRKKIIVYEYWGNYDVNEDGIAEPIVCSWVNDTIIRLQSNPYPDGKPPFIVVPFNAVPFQMYGEANAELIGDNQKIKTAILRGIIDNMAQSNNGQIGIRKGALDQVNRKKWLQGKNFEFNGTPQDFWQGSYNSLPNSAFDVIGLMNNEIESLTGTKSFSGGINGSSLGSTATAARGAMDATSVRRMNLVRNIAENLVKPMLRKWMSYNSEFLEDEEVVRITNDQFVPIRKDDLDGKIDIDLTIATAEDQAAKAQELSFLLQTLGNNIDPEITKELMAQVLDLSRMPDQAEKIRSHQPQQDPMQEQLKQLEIQRLQLENMKLQSEITRNQSIAEENAVDQRMKTARAMKDEAQTRVLHSKADIEDMTFLQMDAGVDHERALDMEVIRHKARLDERAFEAMQKDKDRAQYTTKL